MALPLAAHLFISFRVILSLSALGPVTLPQPSHVLNTVCAVCVCDVRVALMIISVDFGSLSKTLCWL